MVSTHIIIIIIGGGGGAGAGAAIVTMMIINDDNFTMLETVFIFDTWNIAMNLVLQGGVLVV